MKIDIKEITSGSRDGELVWICDYRHNDINKKPIRHIRPTQVMIRSNNEINKTIYYSNSHFAKLNKKGEPLKSGVIPVFDNTGYRSFTGVPVDAFDDETECNEAYIEMAMDVREQVRTLIVPIKKRLQELDELIRG